MDFKTNADRVSGAVFLIGLGLLFTPLSGVVGGFFPGILFVIGASAIARGVAEGQEWHQVSGGIGIIAVGLFFLLGFNLGLLLILIGLGMLFGYNYKPEWFGKEPRHSDEFVSEKRKHDEFV